MVREVCSKLKPVVIKRLTLSTRKWAHDRAQPANGDADRSKESGRVAALVESAS